MSQTEMTIERATRDLTALLERKLSAVRSLRQEFGLDAEGASNGHVRRRRARKQTMPEMATPSGARLKAVKLLLGKGEMTIKDIYKNLAPHVRNSTLVAFKTWFSLERHGHFVRGSAPYTWKVKA